MLTKDGTARYKYIKSLDVMVAGTTHRKNVLNHGKKGAHYIQELDLADHILIEGTKDYFLNRGKIYKYSYEHLAHDLFGDDKPKMYLLEGSDFAEPHTEQMSTDHYWMLHYLHHITTAHERNYTQGTFDLEMKRLLDSSSYSFMPSFKPEVISEIMSYVFQFHKERTNEINRISRRFLFYDVMVQDYQIYGPKVLQYAQNNEGRKLVIVGELHMDGIAHHIETGAVLKPDWFSLAKKMKPGEFEVYSEVTNTLFPELRHKL